MPRKIYLTLLICTLLHAPYRSCVAGESPISSVTSLTDARLHRDFPAICVDGEGTPWVAIVQEKAAIALQPVEDVEGIFTRAGFVAIIVFGLLLGILWYLINRASA